jgi:hypothetical protein
MVLKFNPMSHRYMTEIDAKTTANIIRTRRRQVPRYHQQIRAITIDEDLIDELEWKTQQFRQQKDSLEGEIAAHAKEFEDIKLLESQKYAKIKAVYDKVAKEHEHVNTKLNEFNALASTIITDAESSVTSLQDKVSTVETKISSLATSSIHPFCNFNSYIGTEPTGRETC